MGGRYHFAVAGALAGFVGLFLLVAPHDPAGWETETVEAATELPAGVGVPLEVVMQLGRRSVVPLIAVGAYLVTRRLALALSVAVVGLLAGLSIGPLKEGASRGRPTGVPIRDPVDGFGFPSGHTAVAWAVAVVVAASLPARWRWVPLLLATLVGLARVYVGAHYPLDVVGGTLWGIVLGGAVVAVSARSTSSLASGDHGDPLDPA